VNEDRCTSTVSAPGSDGESLDCELLLGHEGPHVAHENNSYQRLTLTWEDLPQPEPTPEERARMEEIVSRYRDIAPGPVGIITHLSRAASEEVKSGEALTWRMPSYRGLTAGD
jgi:hypothetical protein